MTIVNLRGTHGSGKSTVATKIMAKYGAQPVIAVDGKSLVGYNVQLPTGLLFVVGKYETACGGCDGIQPYDRIWPRVSMASLVSDHILFEGALISTTYGSIGKASEIYGEDFVFAFLDTPLDVCVTRVNARRAERGVEPIVDTKNIYSKYETIKRLYNRLCTGDAKVPQRQTKVIRHTHAVMDTTSIFGVSLKKEPT